MAPLPDREVVEVQIGRRPRSAVDVVARCHLGLPVVIAVPPYLDDGVPFPTTYWLTCPLASRRIGRLEADGGVKKAERRIAAEPKYAERFHASMSRYEADRDARIPDDAPEFRPTGGVGGSRRGVKCLHAHYADHAAGNDNPVGEETAVSIEPLDCSVPCVADVGGGTPAGGAEQVIAANPAWREPVR